MRKSFRKLLAGTMAVALLVTSVIPSGMGGFNKDVVKAYASSGEENGNEEAVSVDWSYELLEDGTIEITGCDISYDDTSEEVKVVVPSQIDGYDVTIIGNVAFESKDCITSIVIPEGVKSIGDNAFANCIGLTSVEIPSSVTSIGFRVFGGCDSLTSIQVAEDNEVYDSRNNCNAIIETASNTLIQGCNSSIIPSDVINITSDAFSDLDSLSNIEIPSSVTNIGDFAFSDCDNLTSIEIPSSVVSIGDCAFYSCGGLINIQVDENNEI